MLPIGKELVSVYQTYHYTKHPVPNWVSYWDYHSSHSALLSEFTFVGPPSSPHNLSYNFGTTRNDTHLPITFSWFLPLSESRDNHAAEGLVLSYTPISETADEKLELSNEITNVTVFLPYNVTYDVIFYSISCGGNLKSDNISISITLPGYKNISIFHPGYERCKYTHSK